MVKIIVLYVIVLVAFAVVAHGAEGSNAGEKPAAYAPLFWIHVVLSAALVLFGLAHGIGHLAGAPAANAVTGCLLLACLVAQVVLGIVTKVRDSAGTKRAHKILPWAILVLAICHVAVRVLA